MAALAPGPDAGLRCLAVAALAALLISACGDEEGSRAVGVGEALRAGEGGTLAFALSGQPRDLDPLRATSRSSQLVTRQIHEPLVESLTGPYGDQRRLPGLAEAYRPSGDRTIWRFELRQHVRFSDGTPFNAAAVLANAERWLTLPEGAELLPTLLAVDAPRPDLVRFILSEPDRELPARLSSPRLGIVSPGALRPRSGHGAELVRLHGTGTGAFELRLREPGRVLLVRNVRWWGTRLQLGPALDQVELPAVPDRRERLELLRSGQVQVADDLPAADVRALRRDPLLTYSAEQGEPLLGFERSVRGIEPADGVPVLSGVWLTTVGAAGAG